MLDAIYDQRAFIWGDLVAQAARVYQVDLRHLHADTMAMTFAGLFANQPAVEGVPRLEPGYNPAGEWLQQLKLFALATGDGGLPVWFDALDGGTGDSTTYAPQFAAFAEHARLANFLPLEEIILLGDRKMPIEENQLTWLRLGLGYIGPVTLQEHHRQTLQELLAAGQRWEELPYVAQREAHKWPVWATSGPYGPQAARGTERLLGGGAYCGSQGSGRPHPLLVGAASVCPFGSPGEARSGPPSKRDASH